MEIAWGIIQGIGSIVGLATGAFLLWDYLTKRLPTAIIEVEPLMTGSVNKRLVLRVKNNADRPLIVSWTNERRNGRFQIAKDDSIHEIVSAAIGGSRSMVLNSGETFRLLLMAPPDKELIDPDNRIETLIWWRFAQPYLFKIPFRIRVGAKKSDLAVMDPDDYGRKEHMDDD